MDGFSTQWDNARRPILAVLDEQSTRGPLNVAPRDSEHLALTHRRFESEPYQIHDVAGRDRLPGSNQSLELILDQPAYPARWLLGLPHPRHWVLGKLDIPLVHRDSEDMSEEN